MVDFIVSAKWHDGGCTGTKELVATTWKAKGMPKLTYGSLGTLELELLLIKTVREQVAWRLRHPSATSRRIASTSTGISQIADGCYMPVEG